MSLNIKKPEAHALAERLAKLTGETLTEAVTTALRERLARIEQTAAHSTRLSIKNSRRLPRIAASTMKEPYLSMEHGDLLYDERGLPK